MIPAEPGSTLDAIACGFLQASQREPGGRGRIRTFVARKERQIYSLLVLATHPPVPRKLFETRITSPELVLQRLAGVLRKNTKRTRVKRHQPVRFCFQDSLRLTPPAKSLVELAEGIEPPTL